ncbi:MAG: PhoX family phosphatase [Reyranellaceae bacterium]
MTGPTIEPTTEPTTELLYADPQDDIGSNRSDNPEFRAVVAARLSRRAALRGLVALGAGTALGGPLGSALIGAARAADAPGAPLTFEEIAHGADQTHHVAKGYSADVLIRWGDPVTAGAPGFDPARQSPAAQAAQFGYNNDYLAYLPLPLGSNSSESGLLWVNHEYTNTGLMFPGVDGKGEKVTREMVEIELNAHGGSVVEVRKSGGKWQAVRDSRYNRRITMNTPMRVSGPAAGHERMVTQADPTGRRVLGTLNNCGGGKTPWGTVLTAEENFHQYFAGDITRTAEAGNYARYGVGRSVYSWWARNVDRFDIGKEAREANRFGWVVEIDPYDPASTPVKRTALGRFKHEAANCVLNRDGRVVVYTGDDETNEYVYRFVTAGRFNPRDRRANMNLLDSGTLSVARFDIDGSLTWLPLVQGRGPLTPENGFRSQADVAIDTRRAADLLGATKMDRPEDVEANPVTGAVYVMLTNNTARADGQTNAANPRAKSEFGHIVAMVPPGGRGKDADHAAAKYTWSIPILAGDPSKPEIGARYGRATTRNGWFASPDNVAFDPRGRMYVATDQGGAWPKTGTADGIWACEVEGTAAYVTRFLYRVPIGAEMCGPEFTPDGRTLFVAVQHPAADGVKDSSFATPATRWPDFQPGMPPRPSVVAITRPDGGEIGS